MRRDNEQENFEVSACHLLNVRFMRNLVLSSQGRKENLYLFLRAFETIMTQYKSACILQSKRQRL
jgi:hypothetical protein